MIRSRFLICGFLSLAVIGSISYFLFFSSIFQIEKITISGNSKVPQEKIESLVGPNNLFLADTKKIAKDILDSIPSIAKAEVSREFPDALSIAVAERAALAQWCQDDKCFLLDGDGIIFEEVLTPEAATGLIKIAGEKEILGKEKISQILEIKAKLSEIAGVTTTRAFIVSRERLNVEISESWEIYFNTEGDLDWQVQELGLVLEKQISPEKRRKLEYVDLRFSRVYYK